MANVKKCDRCGKIYAINNNNFGRKARPGATMKYINTVANGDYNEESIDFCDECWGKFYKWIENGKSISDEEGGIRCSNY